MQPPNKAGTRRASRLAAQPERLKRVAWWLAAAIGAGLLVSVTAPFSSALFPIEAVTNCTVTEQAVELRKRRSLGRIHNLISTTCGTFRSNDLATCTADTGVKTQLVPGVSYDLRVRGTELPLLLSREIVSATVAPEQEFSRSDTNISGDLKQLTPDTENAELNKIIEDINSSPESLNIDAKIDELQASFSPEVLRAFDYQQPPFQPACDVTRKIMTSKGIQLMDPERAAEVLALPPGITPRAELLPCTGHQCSPSTIE